ncbi:cell division protein FtsA [Chlamydiota bacterium]
MPKKKQVNSDIIVGLDVGTTKICAIVAEKTNTNQIHIIGLGHGPSIGLRKGCVINIESTVESIGNIIDEAERAAGVEIHSVFTGIAGGHIKSMNSHGLTHIQKEDGEIGEEDITRAINAAKAISLPMDRELIHAIPQTFTVDGQGGVKDPRGMSGVRLEAEVHIITGAITSAHNIIKCINRAGVQVEDIVLEPLASSIATLNKEEKDSGVILIDMGGGTTDYLLYVNNTIKHSNVLAVGGDHITNDIAIGFKIPSSKAEELKKTVGCCHLPLIDEKEEFILPGVLNRPSKNIPCSELGKIIHVRTEEIFSIIKNDIESTGLGNFIGSGVVLTGGASLMKGTLELAQDVFCLPTRLGKPQHVAGLVDVIESPVYATGVGLLTYGYSFRENGGGGKTYFQGRNVFSKIIDRMKKWISDYF